MSQVVEERFVARAGELARLQDAYRRACGGHGSVTVILAEAGGGKTRLVDEFAAGVVATGGSFAWGRSVEDATVVYRPWRQAFRRLGIPFPVPDVEGTVGPDQRSGRLLEIAEDALGALADAAHAAPVVVALDDVQWADDASLHLLRLLTAEVGDLPVLVLATSRHPEPGSAVEATLGSILGRPAVTTLRLPPLTLDDVAEYLAGHPDAEAAE